MRDGRLGAGVASQRLHGGFVTIANGHLSTLRHRIGADTGCVNRAQVVLLTRAGCSLCEKTAARLAELAGELDFDVAITDVDAAAAAGDSALRSEYGDRLPVVLLDGREHSYWELDEPRLRADLAK
jgi:glutaredoxin